MGHKIYSLVSGAIFFVVAAAHLARLIKGWEITIAGWNAPPWVSIPGLIVPGVLSAWGFALAFRNGARFP